MWRDTARALGLDPTPGASDQPVVRIVKEKRATLAQTPAALRLRPGVRTRWSNLALAGDWIDTGYPATIASAVRSGAAAATALACGRHPRWRQGLQGCRALVRLLTEPAAPQAG